MRQSFFFIPCSGARRWLQLCSNNRVFTHFCVCILLLMAHCPYLQMFEHFCILQSLVWQNLLFFLSFENTQQLCFFYSTQHFPVIIFRFSLLPFPLSSCIPPLSAPSISPSRFSPPGRCSVLLAAKCFSSQLVFPLINNSFISGRHTCLREGVGWGAAVRQLMLSAGGDFTTEFQGPQVSRRGPGHKGLTWEHAKCTIWSPLSGTHLCF